MNLAGLTTSNYSTTEAPTHNWVKFNITKFRTEGLGDESEVSTYRTLSKSAMDPEIPFDKGYKFVNTSRRPMGLLNMQDIGLG